MKLKIFVGYDKSEDLACCVAAHSIMARTSHAVSIEFLEMGSLFQRNLYYRNTEVKEDGSLWDTLSDAPMSTEHAIARFFVPHLAAGYDLALFVDGDILVRDDIYKILENFNDRYAVMCVKHTHLGGEGKKKGGKVQTSYRRKNWSSVMLWNLKHPAHKKLTIKALNSRPGRDYHAFYWIKDSEIGALPAEWNYLIGVTAAARVPDPKIVHFTLGLPYIDGYRNCEFADEWNKECEGMPAQQEAKEICA